MRVSSFWQRINAACKPIPTSLLVLASYCVHAQHAENHLNLEQLINDVHSHLQQHYSHLSLDNGYRVEIKVKQLDPRLRLTACSTPIHYDLRDTGNTGGNVSVHTQCQGSSPWAVYIPAEVGIFKPVIVASRNVERGSTLADSDFDSEWRDTSKLNQSYVTDSSRLRGKSAARRIRSGEAIRLSSVTEPMAIKRGDAVVVEAQAGSITVSTQGIALSNGRVGEQISVRNSQSERIVRVKIIGPGRAQVIL